MVTFINRLTGSTMFVADDRVDEYKAMGHTIADTPTTADASDVEVPAEKKPRKKSTKEQ